MYSWFVISIMLLCFWGIDRWWHGNQKITEGQDLCLGVFVFNLLCSICGVIIKEIN